jgi:hypothetical protein
MLRRVADVLGATVHVEIKEKTREKSPLVAERRATYGVKKKRAA